MTAKYKKVHNGRAIACIPTVKVALQSAHN